MLFLIAIAGGWLLMMGHQTRSESLFYYFRLEDQIPETHLLRLSDRHLSFDFVREKLKESYSDTGRPSIDPEVLLRIVLIGYLYGISERKLLEELRMHVAWRWFTAGLNCLRSLPAACPMRVIRVLCSRTQATVRCKPFSAMVSWSPGLINTVGGCNRSR